MIGLTMRAMCNRWERMPAMIARRQDDAAAYLSAQARRQRSTRASVRGGRKGDRRHFEDISDALRASGALDYTRECAQREAQHAASALRAFPHSIYTQSLLELCAYSTTRKF